MNFGIRQACDGKGDRQGEREFHVGMEGSWNEIVEARQRCKASLEVKKKTREERRKVVSVINKNCHLIGVLLYSW